MTPEIRTAGEHEICREEADFFVYRFPRGAATAAHVAELATLEQPLWEERPAHVYNMTVLGEDLVISPGAITATAKIYGKSPPRTTAFVARRFFHRTAMEFLTRTIRTFGVSMRAKVFEDEASARAWIVAQRDRRSRPSVT